MIEEEKDNLYVWEEEEDDMNMDSSPRNFAAYREDNEEIEDAESQEEEHDEVSGFGLMIRIMLSPVEGWKKLRRCRVKPESLQSGCFYPLLAILAISKFADYFYSVNISLSQLVTESVIEFVAYFFSFFCIDVLLAKILPKDMSEKFNVDFGKSYLLIALSTIVLFSILKNLLPMLWPILFFLPIWTIYLMFKGVRFFKFHERQEMKFYIYSVVGVIGMPLLIEWALTSILPY